MNINDKMDYSEKITEFIDGELNQEESKELFNHLAYNSELQEELRNSLKLKNMFHQELMPPPPMAKTHLYAKLNLQRSAVVLSFLLTILINLRKLFMSPAFSSALIGIGLFTLGLFMTNSESKINTEKESIGRIVQEKQIPQTKQKLSSFVPFTSSSNTAAKLSRSNVNTRKSASSESFIDEIPETSVNNFIQFNENNATNFNETETIMLIPAEITESDLTKNGIMILRNNFRKNFISAFGYEISNILERISLSLNKTNSISTLNNGLQPLSIPLLNNYSISVTFSIDKHHSLAAELGQENFSQNFNGEINGLKADVKQVYTAQWYGLSYQYNFGEIDKLYGLNPFIKTLVSGTNIGPFFKGSLGISYNLTEKISLQGALEASRLAYSFQSNWFQTDKYGFVYGIKIGF